MGVSSELIFVVAKPADVEIFVTRSSQPELMSPRIAVQRVHRKENVQLQFSEVLQFVLTGTKHLVPSTSRAN